MEMHYRPEDQVTHYYPSASNTSNQPPRGGSYTGTYGESSSLMAVGPSYGVSLESLDGPTPCLMPSPMWSCLPEDMPSQELLSQLSLQSAALPLAERKHPISKTNAARRRNLTNERRRNIRLYYEKNNTVPHSKIAALFGVERSTVTKTLRSTKYQKPDNERQCRLKGALKHISKLRNQKPPDVEKALSNWATKRQSEGLDIDESQFLSQAQHFASACGYSSHSCEFQAQKWLENFKTRNLSRKLPNDPLRSNDPNTPYTPTTTNCLSMDGTAVWGLGVRPGVAVENGAGRSMFPTETGEGPNNTGVNPQVGIEVEVEKALGLVKNYFERQELRLSFDESASLDRLRDVIKERIPSSGPFS